MPDPIAKVSDASDDSLDLSAISADLKASKGQGDPGDIFNEGQPPKEKTMAEMLAEQGAKLKKAPVVQAEPVKRALTFAEQL